MLKLEHRLGATWKIWGFVSQDLLKSPPLVFNVSFWVRKLFKIFHNLPSSIKKLYWGKAMELDQVTTNKNKTRERQEIDIRAGKGWADFPG